MVDRNSGVDAVELKVHLEDVDLAGEDEAPSPLKSPLRPASSQRRSEGADEGLFPLESPLRPASSKRRSDGADEAPPLPGVFMYVGEEGDLCRIDPVSGVSPKKRPCGPTVAMCGDTGEWAVFTADGGRIPVSKAMSRFEQLQREVVAAAKAAGPAPGLPRRPSCEDKLDALSDGTSSRLDEDFLAPDGTPSRLEEDFLAPLVLLEVSLDSKSSLRNTRSELNLKAGDLDEVLSNFFDGIYASSTDDDSSTASQGRSSPSSSETASHERSSPSSSESC